MSQIGDNDRIKKAIVKKLTEMDKLDDGELPDYILVMVNNRRDKRDMEHDLNLFLGDDTQKFINWLFDFTRRGSRRGFREEGEVSPDREGRSMNCPAIGNPGLRKLVENYDKDTGNDVEDVKKWEKIEGEDDELMIKGSDEEDEDWKNRKDRKRALSPGERRAIEKMNAQAISRQKAGTLKGALSSVVNMRNTTINDDFLRRADMAKKDGTIPKHAVFAVPRATPEESDRKQEVSSRDRDSRDSRRDSSRRDRDSDRGRSDRDRDRKRSRSPKRDEYRSKKLPTPRHQPTPESSKARGEAERPGRAQHRQLSPRSLEREQREQRQVYERR